MNEHHPFTANVALGLLGALLALSTTIWSGAQLAARFFGAGHWLDASLSDAAQAFLQLGGHLTDPRAAWPVPIARGLPGPAVYWACTGAMFVLASLLALPMVSFMRMPSAGSARRRRLGVDAQAR